MQYIKNTAGYICTQKSTRKNSKFAVLITKKLNDHDKQFLWVWKKPKALCLF